eukprot:CAMPEP_0115859230 /NCGR_PEP_ID=MMETSP0287-20121206/16509_1 /TAXON_ID=412157 /ORGANISM="Chrysochromulina rotalis, Strain UIO044" /LENGTH=52 /DNA_ID=CAMNT_0003313525 /DNA_START=823 /DNA_END=977 /DNA_ORIENTATION=-
MNLMTHLASGSSRDVLNSRFRLTGSSRAQLLGVASRKVSSMHSVSAILLVHA